MSTRRRSIPGTPRVISPSPTPSEKQQQQDGLSSSQDSSYFGPMTRSATRRRVATPLPLAEHADEGQEEDNNNYDFDEDDSNPELRRSRTRSRSPMQTRRMSGLTAVKSPTPAVKRTMSNNKKAAAAAAGGRGGIVTNGKASSSLSSPSETNGHLSPPSAAPAGWSWRDFSRSPSPLGLIPIHRHWRNFVHKHEVPRKLLHVSIGFLVIWLYAAGAQTSAVWPYLAVALVPIAATDYLRHHYPAFNRLYVKVLGALMRESEFAGYNGVIFYLLGACIVLALLPKDVATLSTLLLSWCDTAASTFGRLYGRYTPRIRRGKSLAGSAAAFLVGTATAAAFWGWLAPVVGPMPGDEDFMFKGALHLPAPVAAALGITKAVVVDGGLALAIMSLWSGLMASASEVVDLFGWDDNLTIPVLSGLGIWGFLKIFG